MVSELRDSWSWDLSFCTLWFLTLVSDSGFILILSMKFFCICWCVYYLFDILSNWKILLQIFNFLQDSSFSIFDSLLFYFLHSKKWWLLLNFRLFNLLSIFDSLLFYFLHSKKWWLLLNFRLFNLLLPVCFLRFLLLWQSSLMIQIISFGTFRCKFFWRVMEF